MNNKRKLILLWVVISILLLIILSNIASFFIVRADQFNIFHKYSETHLLENWNIPNNVDIDINEDGINDRVTWTGCAILGGSADESIVADQYDCDENTRSIIRVFEISDRPFQVRLSYAAKSPDGDWKIVYINNLSTRIFDINEEGEVISVPVPFSLQADTALYFASHLFVFIIGM